MVCNVSSEPDAEPCARRESRPAEGGAGETAHETAPPRGPPPADVTTPPRAGRARYGFTYMYAPCSRMHATLSASRHDAVNHSPQSVQSDAEITREIRAPRLQRSISVLYAIAVLRV